MDPTPWRTWVPSDERKQVGPDPAKPRKHGTGGQYPSPNHSWRHSLSWSLISTRSIPSFDGSVVIEPPLIVTGVAHVRSHWRRLPGDPATGPPRRESRVSGFLEWFHGEAGDPGKSRHDPDENGN